MPADLAMRDASVVAASGTCHHCGEILPASPVMQESGGRPRGFCCQGCAAAAEWIAAAPKDGETIIAHRIREIERLGGTLAED